MLTLLLGKAHLVEPDFGKPTPMTGIEHGGGGAARGCVCVVF